MPWMHDSPEELTPFVDVAETHSGAVLFVGDRAYKLKKPLDLGFVDYRTSSRAAAPVRRRCASTDGRPLMSTWASAR